MDIFNQFMTNEPFIAAIVLMMIGAFVGAYIKDGIQWFRKFLASKSKKQALKTLNEINEQVSMAEFLHDNPQYASVYFTAGLIRSFWVMGGAVTVLISALIPVLTNVAKDNPIVSIIILIAYLMFNIGVLQLGFLDERYRNAAMLDKFKELAFAKVKKLAEKYDIEVSFHSNIQTTVDENKNAE